MIHSGGVFSALFVAYIICSYVPGEANAASNVSVNVSLTMVVMGNSEECKRGLTSPGDIYLQYRTVLIKSSSRTGPWNLFEVISLSKLSNSHHNFSFSVAVASGELQGGSNSYLQFRLIQLEHGGGYCNCWGVQAKSWSVVMMAGSSQPTTLQECGFSGQCQQSAPGCSEDIKFCSGSASVPRGVISDVYSIMNERSHCEAGLTEVIKKTGLPLSNCDTTSDKVVLNFQLSMFFSSSSCGSLSGADKGVEVAIRRSKDGLEQWIPLRYFLASFDRQEEIKIGKVTYVSPSSTTFCIRGYDVPAETFQLQHTASIEICDSVYFGNNSVQFRWLQTARFRKNGMKDVWRLDYATLTVKNGSMWTLVEKIGGIRNGARVESTVCSDASTENGLLFNGTTDTIHLNSSDYVIVSRSITTTSISLGGGLVGVSVPTMPQPVSTQPVSTQPVSTQYGAIPIVSVKTCPPGPVEDILMCLKDLLNTNDGSSDDVVEGLASVVSLLMMSTSRLSNEVTKEFLAVASEVINKVQEGAMTATAGSSLLDLLDRFAAHFIMEDTIIITDNIILITTRGNDSSSINFDVSQDAIDLPEEIFSMFMDREGNEEGTRVLSLLYRDVTSLFPDQDNVTVFSDVLSAAILCGSVICNTSNLTLASNVTITIAHQEPLEVQEDRVITCVYWEFGPRNENGVRNSGNWSDRGCFKNQMLSDANQTVCQCNHLTHFAILLSPSPQVLSMKVATSLEFIGYIGVSISLVAMAITVFTFIVLKSLRSMRNYIHINLCISLATAQITFVVGVDKTGPPNGDVPIHCQVISVFLHYFFLVTFMWMLMEGVVLYVALVRVFVKHKRRYIVAFTVASYGLPLLYMGLLTLPLGFGLSDEPYYGSSEACFLKTPFVWAFIGPVILIFLANIGFLIMAASIMWHHQMKRIDKTKNQNVRSWLRSSLTLMVIMGLTWIIGIFLVERSELLFLAYIYTILVSFQGLFIFLIFVVFSETVREAYVKWWRIKVNESTILSKYFGDKTIGKFTSATTKANGVNHCSQNGTSDKHAATVSQTETIATLLASTSFSSSVPSHQNPSKVHLSGNSVKCQHGSNGTGFTTEEEISVKTEPEPWKKTTVEIVFDDSVTIKVEENENERCESFALDFS